MINPTIDDFDIYPEYVNVFVDPELIGSCCVVGSFSYNYYLGWELRDIVEDDYFGIRVEADSSFDNFEFINNLFISEVHKLIGFPNTSVVYWFEPLTLIVLVNYTGFSGTYYSFCHSTLKQNIFISILLIIDKIVSLYCS